MNSFLQGKCLNPLEVDRLQIDMKASVEWKIAAESEGWLEG